MSEKIDLFEDVTGRLRNYLLANGLRQTKERYAILGAVYHMEGPFTIDELQEQMSKNRFPVSQSAAYATMQLLVQANLVIRHPFSSTGAVFERIDDNRPRSYQICNNCHKITRIRSRELAEAVTHYHPRRFGVSHKIVYVYGTCPKCDMAMRKKLKQLRNS